MLPQEFRANAPQQQEVLMKLKLFPFFFGNIILLKEKGGIRESIPRQVDKSGVPEEEREVRGS